jgi:hypothetical protein
MVLRKSNAGSENPLSPAESDNSPDAVINGLI